MARPKLVARFFVNTDGVAVEIARPLSPSEATRIYERDSWTCKKCRKKVRRGGLYDSPFDPDEMRRCGSIDHIIPRKRGGQNNHENLQVLCRSCNCSKGADL